MEILYTEGFQVYTINRVWLYSVLNMILVIILITKLYRIGSELNLLESRNLIMWHNIVGLIFYVWLYSGEEKVESTEELVSLIILWPWCIFLVFTHLLSIERIGSVFCFVEWGLPIICGLLLLIEHVWSYGVYIIIYLTGIRGRKNVISSLIEDLMTLFIMVARVLLQAVRGIIVGMFHFICREALLNMSQWWTVESMYNSNTSKTRIWSSAYIYIIEFVIDLIIGGCSLLGIMAIMFLQLTFLVISVWLFCKCWFISYNEIYRISNTQININDFIIDRIRLNETTD